MSIIDNHNEFFHIPETSHGQEENMFYWLVIGYFHTVVPTATPNYILSPLCYIPTSSYSKDPSVGNFSSLLMALCNNTLVYTCTCRLITCLTKDIDTKLSSINGTLLRSTFNSIIGTQGFEKMIHYFHIFMSCQWNMILLLHTSSNCNNYC